MKNVFVVLERKDSGLAGVKLVDAFAAVRTTLEKAMVVAYGVKPAVVLEVSTKPGDGDKPVKRAEIK